MRVVRIDSLSGTRSWISVSERAFGQMARSFTSVRPEIISVPLAIGISGLRKRPSGPRCPTRSSVIWLAPPDTALSNCPFPKGS